MITIVGRFLKQLYRDCGKCVTLEFGVYNENGKEGKVNTYFVWDPSCDSHKPQ